MLFKSLLKAIMVCALLVACSEESIPRHQKRMADDQGGEAKEETVVKEYTQFSDSHKKINELIISNDPQKVSTALLELEQVLFSPQSKDPKVHTSASYVGYVQLYVKVFVYWKANQNQEPLNQNLLGSLLKFRTQFVDSCVDPDVKECSMLKESLVKNRSTIVIVNYLIEQESDLKKKLALIGYAYDLMGRRQEVRLNELYTSAMMEVLNKENEGETVLSAQQLKQHTINISALMNNTNWTSESPKAVELFKKIAPWKHKIPVKKTIDYLRADLLNLIPRFAKVDSEVKAGLKAVVAEKIKGMKASGADLSQYPAYDDIKIAEFLNEDPAVVYLLLNVYYQNIGLKDAKIYLSEMTNQEAAATKIYRLSRVLIKWDVAQLSIDSTKRLAKKFMEEEVKSGTFVQDVIDDSAKLVPAWTEFHTSRLPTLKKFVRSNSDLMIGITDKSVRDFYDSIDRNIYKTAVYPNMLAFMYHMAKTEWKMQIRIWFWTINLDTTDIFDYMMTGNYSRPWFNFTNLKKSSGWTDSTRMSLFRSEILDSFHYMISTKTAQEYDVDVDDMIKVVSDTVLRKRMPTFERVMDVQRRIYFTENTPVDQFVDWCQATKQGLQSKEIIPFYALYENIVPSSINLKDIEGTFGAGSSFNARMPLYVNDIYDRNVGSLYNISIVEINDRIRQELLPILHMSKQIYAIADRLKNQYPDQISYELDGAKKHIDQIVDFKKRFLGSQVSAAEKMSDCSRVAGTEGRRRAMQVGFHELQYFRKVVYPLLEKTTRGEITVDEANRVLKSIHKNSYAFIDEISAPTDKAANYKATHIGFMLRVRQYLREGLSVNDPILGQIELPAIVGKNLDIPLPAKLLEDEKSPYFNTNASMRYIRDIKYFEGYDVEEFATSAVRLLTDELYLDSFGMNKFSQWDQYDTSKYFEFDKFRVEYFVQRMLVNGEEYIDLNNVECREVTLDLPKECYKKVDTTLDDIAQEMASIFEQLELVGDKEKYIDLMGKRGFLNSFNMSVQLKYDEQRLFSIYDNLKGHLPYRKASGFFDLPVDMLLSENLGWFYQTEYTIFQKSQQTDDHGGFDCAMVRDGCYWENERIRANQFFISRAKRPGIIYKFDRKILEENYAFNKAEALKKYSLAMEIEENGQALLAKYREGEPEYYFDRNIKPKKLVPLSPAWTQNDYQFDKYFVEKTESFFIDEPDWDKYLDNK